MTARHFDLEASGMTDAQVMSRRPSGVATETFSRADGALANGGVLSSGRLTLSHVAVWDGLTVGSILFHAWTTGGSGLTHTWFCLYSSAMARLAVTTDDTSATWTSSQPKTLALSSNYTFAYTGYAYVGICVVGTTVPTLGTRSISNATNIMTPMLSGTSNTGLTDPASAPSTATGPTGGLTNWAYAQLLRP